MMRYALSFFGWLAFACFWLNSGGLAVGVAADPEPIATRDFEPRDAARDRIVPVRVYLPNSTEAHPVVLFSHGLGGSRENSAYLGNHWAGQGYLCVFLQHAGSDQEVWKSVNLRDRLSALTQAANGKNLRERILDVSFVIDQLEAWNKDAQHPLFKRLDLDHLGMCGHSFGAVTTLAVAGQKYPLGKTFHEPRIDAFFAMSPQKGESNNPQETFGHITFPILCMTGTEDHSPVNNRTTPSSRREVYQALPQGDKYELVFEGGTHSAFSDVAGLRARSKDPAHHPAIQRISLKFWDAYLKNDATAKAWLQSEQPKQDCPLKAADVWQWK